MTTPDEPRTEAGRALLRWLGRVHDASGWPRDWLPPILAIEAEAARSADEARQRVVDADLLHAAWHRETITPRPTWELASNGYECVGPRSQCRVLAAAQRILADIAALDTEAGT